MILDRFLVREKLGLLVVVPLAALVLTTVPFLAERVTDARTAAATQLSARSARTVSQLIQELERERLISIGYLAAPLARRSAVIAAQQDVADATVDTRAALGTDLTPALGAALAKLDTLLATRAAVLGRTAQAGDVLSAFGGAVADLIDALALARQAAAGSVGARQLGALESLLQANEHSSAAGAALIARIAGSAPPSAADAAALERLQTARFTQLAEQAQVDLLTTVGTGATTQQLAGLAGAAPPAASAPGRDARIAAATTAVESQDDLRRLVEDRIARDVTDTAAGQALGARLAAGVIGLLALGVLVLVVMLSVAVGRSISRPLQRLTRAATAVADLSQLELIRVADEENADEQLPQLAAIDVRSNDEIGALAASFNRVQATAALLLERQVVSRRNVASMFANLGRRTHNLVGRQLTIIDRLEREEQDPEALGELYRLDHISARLRRGASSLVVLSGVIGQELTGPRSLADVVRSALGEVEGFRQVRLRAIAEVMIAAPLVADLALVIAELVENAAAVSQPEVMVEVEAVVTADGGCRVTVVDQGIGLSPERLDEENRRLVGRERLDLAPTSMLGLFVVGRLARRHRLTVRLAATPGGGVTAAVDLPRGLVVAVPPRPAERPAGAVAAVSDQLLIPALTALSAAAMPSDDFPWFADDPTADASTAVPADRPEDADVRPEAPAADAAEPAAEPEPATGPIAVADPPQARAGLIRRVKFAQLPDLGEQASDQENRQPAYQDPEAARATVAAFQNGAALGKAQNGAAPTGSRNGAPQTRGQHAGGQPIRPTGRAGLTRRVRGASLSELIPISRSNGARRPSPAPRGAGPAGTSNPAGPTDHDPEAARAMAEAFEGGAARAANDAAAMSEGATAMDEPMKPAEE